MLVVKPMPAHDDVGHVPAKPSPGFPCSWCAAELYELAVGRVTKLEIIYIHD